MLFDPLSVGDENIVLFCTKHSEFVWPALSGVLKIIVYFIVIIESRLLLILTDWGFEETDKGMSLYCLFLLMVGSVTCKYENASQGLLFKWLCPFVSPSAL